MPFEHALHIRDMCTVMRGSPRSGRALLLTFCPLAPSLTAQGTKPEPTTLHAAMAMQTDSEVSGKDTQCQLPSAPQLHILSLVPPNDRALSGRLVFPDAAEIFIHSSHCTASLSQPMPPHAVPWAVAAGQQHVRQLTFRHKLQLLCTAATSGSEVNLEVALALLQPSIFPELLHAYDAVWVSKHVPPQANPGVSAVRAGHPQLLGWLLRHCPGLVERDQVLTAAAKHCDLAGLQAAFGVFCVNLAGQGWILDAAAESATPDAVAKMEWLISISGRQFQLHESTAAAAARSGDLGRLQWLRARGCPMEGLGVLRDALQHADLAVAQWLVDEAGCELPGEGGSDYDDLWEQYLEIPFDTQYDELLHLYGLTEASEGERALGWGSLLEASARSSNGVAKVGWLLQRREAPLQARHWEGMARAAAKAGRVEMVRRTLSMLGPGAVPEGLALAAVGSGSVPMVRLVRHAGAVFDHWAYMMAAEGGSLAMVRWLACEAKVPAEGLALFNHGDMLWPKGPTAATSRELLQAVQLLVDEAGWGGCDDMAGLVWAAAEQGNLALMQYGLQQLQQHQPGYQPHLGVGLRAVEAGCVALLELLAQEHPGCLEGPSMYESAGEAGDLGTLTALRRLGVPWGAEDVVANAVLYEGVTAAALHWLVEQGAPVGSRKDLESSFKLRRKDIDRGIKDWLLGLVGAEAAPWEEA